MKRIMIILLLLALLLPSALAEEVILGPDAQALKLANQALTDTYGHTHETLGLFQVSILRCGSKYRITYTSNGSVPDVLTGEYTALVIDGEAHVIWTHDGADAALWQSGELNSPAWGVKQLTAYLDEHPYTRATFCDPYEAAARAALLDTLSGVTVNEVTEDNRTSAEAASALAREALQAMYGLSREVADRLHWPCDLSGVFQHPEGYPQWHIVLQDNALDILDPITYYVTLNGDTGEILRVTHSSGGVG